MLCGVESGYSRIVPARSYQSSVGQLRCILVSNHPEQRSIEIEGHNIYPYIGSYKGIIEATGDYIIHCDGDDWVDTTLYEALYHLAVNSNADIVVCDEVEEFNGWSQPKLTRDLPEHGKDIMANWYRNTDGMFCHNKLVRRSIYTDNNVYPWVGLNMWEDNGLFARLFYFANRVVQIHDGPVYHYNRANMTAMTAGYGLLQVNQMIGIADNLAVFFESMPDKERYRKTVEAFRYLAILNLITDSFCNYKRYLKALPSCKNAIKHIPLHAFSSKGAFRFLMVKFHMAPVFILLFKAKNTLNRLIPIK